MTIGDSILREISSRDNGRPVANRGNRRWIVTLAVVAAWLAFCALIYCIKTGMA